MDFPASYSFLQCLPGDLPWCYSTLLLQRQPDLSEMIIKKTNIKAFGVFLCSCFSENILLVLGLYLSWRIPPNSLFSGFGLELRVRVWVYVSFLYINHDNLLWNVFFCGGGADYQNSKIWLSWSQQPHLISSLFHNKLFFFFF